MTQLKDFTTQELIQELQGRNDIYVLNWYCVDTIKGFIQAKYGKEISTYTAKSVIEKLKDSNYGSEDASEGIFDYISSILNF